MRRYSTVLIVLTFLLTPFIFVSAAGLVPCDGINCRVCDLIFMGQKILTWFIKIMGTIIALVFVFGGLQMVVSVGDPGKITKAREMMTNALIGFVILLTAWLVVDTVLKTFLREGALLGPWNAVQCVAPVEYKAWIPGESSRQSLTSVNKKTLSDDLAQSKARTISESQFTEILCEHARNNNIGDDCANLQAIMAIESSGDPSAVSPVGAVGLMQITPETAEHLDPTLTGLSGDKKTRDQLIRERLKDPDYNMRLAAQYYAELKDRFDGDTTKIYAAYNGGPGSNAPSANCDTGTKWQCEWDDDDHTVPNTGFKETRNYVVNVTKVSEQIKASQSVGKSK